MSSLGCSTFTGFAAARSCSNRNFLTPMPLTPAHPAGHVVPPTCRNARTPSPWVPYAPYPSLLIAYHSARAHVYHTPAYVNTTISTKHCWTRLVALLTIITLNTQLNIGSFSS